MDGDGKALPASLPSRPGRAPVYFQRPRMALLHLITAGLLLAGGSTAGPSLPTLAIDLRPLDRATFEALEQAGIYQGLVIRLVPDRVALVDPKERADILFRMEPGANPQEVLVTASNAAGSRSARVSIRDLERDDVRLRLLHTSVELVRQVQALAVPASPGAPRVRARLELDGGALWSAGKPGALARLAGGIRAGPGELDLGLVLHRPLSSPPDLNVTEWGLFAGVGTGERAVSSRGRVAAGLKLGLWQHRWQWSGTPEDSGSKLDGAALLHGGVSLRLGTSWRIGLDAGVLWTLHARVHRTSSAELWQAPRLRPFAGLTAGFAHEAGN